MAHVNCPKCGGRLHLPPIQEAQGVRCPACKHEFTVSPPNQPPPLPSNDTGNTYTAPQSENFAPQEPQSTQRVDNGIRRLPYFGLMMGLAIIPSLLGAALRTTDGAEAIGLMCIPVALTVVYSRLKNTGMNPWWCMLALVPIAHLLLVIPCLAFQEGYCDTMKLDATGKVIIRVLVGLFVGLLIVAILAFAL